MNEQVFGTNIKYDRRGLSLGLTAYRMLLDHYVKPANYRYNYYYFTGSANSNIGLDAAYRHNNTIYFGEFSLSANGHKATLVGVDQLLSSGNYVGLHLHHYDAYYWNLHASALSVGGHTRNESAVTLNTKIKLPLKINAQTILTYAHYPEMRSTVYFSSDAFVAHCRLSRHIYKNLQGAVVYRFSSQGHNIKDNNNYSLDQATQHQLQTDLKIRQDEWLYTLRFKHSWYALSDESSQGSLIYGDIQYEPSNGPLAASLRLAYFDVDDYDARLYTSECGLAYDNSGIFYMHRGIRFYAVLHYQPARRLSLSVKYSISQYLDGTLYGSGNEALDVSHRQQLRIQMRLLF